MRILLRILSLHNIRAQDTRTEIGNSWQVWSNCAMEKSYAFFFHACMYGEKLLSDKRHPCFLTSVFGAQSSGVQ